MSVRKVRYYNRTGPVLGLGYRSILDVSARFGRPTGFYLPAMALAPLDAEELAASETLKLDHEAFIARIEAGKAAMAGRGERYDVDSVDEVIRILRSATPRPLPPARVRTRRRADVDASPVHGHARLPYEPPRVKEHA